MSTQRFLRGIGWFFLACMTAFATAALFYSTLEPDSLRNGLAVLFPTCVLIVFFIRRFISMTVSLTALFVVFWGWYLTDPPRNDRDWAGEYAVPADATLNGRVAHIAHVRNFTYRTTEDYTPHYYDADYNLDDLTSLDLITSYWAGESIAHVFLSFGFKDGRHLALSIETRRQKTFSYSAIAGFFHHYETFYVTADERDLIGVRTDIRKERVYLYTLTLSPQARERLFLSYLAEIHHLTVQPEWYNTLTDNCTTGILTRAQAKWRYRLDWRVLLSGYTASLAYDLGLLQTHGLSFPALKQASRIQRPAHAALDDSFSTNIRTTPAP
ncbi:Lnb N-terminal periplasmic domain-containing protein [Acetobacter cibinongensis]|uniref:Lnb N-terminal periplasmic domain-containing protein n=1 Tax=Acetobacter cibinongensis TaxID=146475 RepID=A0A1Z5YR68_9PROT|nr:DUF4105 domain-containing protein [Acetobacter cibinongensis]OUI98226.1 hypothetical protein HK14_15745 [Acetobacter cibinongensis]